MLQNIPEFSHDPRNDTNPCAATWCNNLITILCLVLVLHAFILNYLERRERVERMKYAYYVATDGEVIPARYAQRRAVPLDQIRHHLSMFVEDWAA